MAIETADFEQSIEKHFKAQLSDTPIAYENREFKEPAGTPWVRITIRLLSTGREVMTGDRRTGHLALFNILVQLYTPMNAGPMPMRLLRDAVRAALEEADVTSTSGRRISIGTMLEGATRPDPKGPWHQKLVTFTAEALER